MKSILVLLAAVALIQGCSTTRTSTSACALNDNGNGACKSMEDAYAAVRSGATGKASIFENGVEANGMRQPGKAPAYGYLGNYPEPDKATPVFQQPKVFRPWLAPFVDADGVLHSGEYAYFNTPGSWNYGELRKPGAGGAVMGPVKPWETGVVPGAVKARAAGKPESAGFSKPPAPPESAPAVAQVPGPSAGPTPAAGGISSGITQPYQRLN